MDAPAEIRVQLGRRLVHGGKLRTTEAFSGINVLSTVPDWPFIRRRPLIGRVRPTLHSTGPRSIDACRVGSPCCLALPGQLRFVGQPAFLLGQRLTVPSVRPDVRRLRPVVVFLPLNLLIDRRPQLLAVLDLGRLV